MKPIRDILPDLRFLGLIALLFVNCRLFFEVPPYIPSPQEQLSHAQIDVAEKFLQALLTEDEDTATSYMSMNMRSAVDEYCGGHVVDCLNTDGVEIGEKIAHLLFEVARPAKDTTSTGAVRFLIVWENHTYCYVIVLVISEDDKWVISGWRGWTQNPDGLLGGNNQANAFPPLE